MNNFMRGWLIVCAIFAYSCANIMGMFVILMFLMLNEMLIEYEDIDSIDLGEK